MPAQPLAIVGISTRAAAASAWRAGFQPVTADRAANVDLREFASTTRVSPYPEGLVDWLRAVEPPAWMYTRDLELHPELIDQMAWIAPLWGNAGDVVTEIRDPSLLAATLRVSGHYYFDARRIPDAQPHVDQQQVDGVSCSAIFVANDRSSTLVGVTRQWTDVFSLQAKDLQYECTIAPYAISDQVRDEFESIGRVLAEQFSLIGIFGINFILRDGVVWTIDVEPRYTATTEVVERVLDVSILSAQAAACCGQPVLLPPTGQAVTPFHGRATVCADRTVTINASFCEWALGETRSAPWPKLADISPVGTSITPGLPVATVFAEGCDASEVERRLQERVKMLADRLYGD